MDRIPSQINLSKTLDLKLGIKSSLSKIKMSLALIYFIWLSEEKPSELEYCKQIEDIAGDRILIISNEIKERLFNFLKEYGLMESYSEEFVLQKINSNPIMNSQIEALKVAFELVWKISEFSFLDEKLSFSSERTKVEGKIVRYPKKIKYSRDIDILDLLVKQNENKYLKTIFNWLIDENSSEKNDLVKLFTILSDEAIYRLRIDDKKDIKFNMGGVYRELANEKNEPVLVNDYKENMGGLRILGSILKEELNYFIKRYDKNSRFVELSDTVTVEELKNYSDRISKHFDLLNVDLSLFETNKISDIHLNNFYSNTNKINKPHQRIFFGAPGTGKSYELNKERKEYFGNNYERVTFHPSYMYGNFVGAFKPFPKVLQNSDGTIKKDEDGNVQESITYEYIPGVLMRQLVKALKSPMQNYLLLIEEINRANVTAVFGDIFQLLDRNSFGESEYFIATSKELQEFLKKEFEDCDLEKNIKEKLGEDFGKLYLPNNLYIWATMNSADQGVMPMDTAFRRRWEFRYLGIDDAAESNKEDFERYKFKINSSEVVNWDLFRRELNKKLSSLNIPEDKLIGPYFVSKSILEDSDLDRLTETIKNKVLMYLYEDAAKAYRPSLFAEGKYATYSSVCKYFDDNALSLFKGNMEIKTQSIETNQAYDYRETDEASIAAEDGVEYES
jgi:type II restriction-modification system restriction subunit